MSTAVEERGDSFPSTTNLVKQQDESCNTEQRGHSLKREVSWLNGIGIVVGIVIGSGIFISPTGVLKETQSIGLALFVWLACGIIAILGSLCYVELGLSIPKSGAEYAYLLEAFGGIPAFLFSWTAVMISVPGGRAIVAITFAEYLGKVFFMECDIPMNVTKLLACLCIVVTTALNCWSVKWSIRIIDTFTYGKLICIFVLIVLGAVHLGREESQKNLKDGFQGSNTNLASLAFAIYIGYFAYGGWDGLNSVTEEIKRPEKDMPRALVGGVSIVITVYLLVNVSYIVVLGKAGILESEVVALSMGKAYLGPMYWITSAFVAISTFGGSLAGTFTSSRLVFVAAREGHLPKLLAMIQVDRLTPVPSLIFTTVISIIMLIPKGSSFMTLVGFTSYTVWLFNGGTYAALLWLRWRRPEMNRPFKVWLVIPVVLTLACIYLVIAPAIKDPVGSLIALGITLVGLPLYYIFVHTKCMPKGFYQRLDALTFWCQKAFNLVLEDPNKAIFDTAL